MKRSFEAFVIISVLLNILMGAIIAGHMGRRFIEPDQDRDAQEIAAALPENKRELFTEAMNRAEDDTGNLHEQLSDARKQAASLLKAEPFDKQAYLKQLQKMHDLRGRILQRMGQSVAELAEKFTPEERAVLADMFIKHGPSWHSHKPSDDTIKPDATPTPGKNEEIQH